MKSLTAKQTNVHSLCRRFGSSMDIEHPALAGKKLHMTALCKKGVAWIDEEGGKIKLCDVYPAPKKKRRKRRKKATKSKPETPAETPAETLQED